MDPKRKSPDKSQDDAHNAPASQPELIFPEDADDPEDVPSQAEGDRETIEADLQDKGLETAESEHD